MRFRSLTPAVAIGILVFVTYLALTSLTEQGVVGASGVALVAFCMVEVGRAGGRPGMLLLQLVISCLSGAAIGFYGGALVVAQSARGPGFLYGISVAGPPLGIAATLSVFCVLLWRGWPRIGVNRIGRPPATTEPH